VTVNVAQPTLDFNPMAQDNVLNAVEKGEALTISGTSSDLAANTIVTINFNGKNYTTTTDANGDWTLDVPAADLTSLGEANYTVTASAANDAGNSVSSSANLLVDTSVPTVSIDKATTDDILNAVEIANGYTFTGSVKGAAAGDTVTITIDGKTYTTTVNADLSWSLDLTFEQIAALGNGDATMTVSVTNATGNTGDASYDFSVDIELPILSIKTIAGDDIVNSLEHGQDLVITGTSENLAVGNVITVNVNGKDYNTTVNADGTWSVGIEAADVAAWQNGAVVITANATDAAANTVTADRSITVDLNPFAISIDTVAGDSVLNAAEKGADLVLSGTTTAEAGQTVTITFAGKNYTTTVNVDGSWEFIVPAADMVGLKDGDTTVAVSVDNQAGNTATTAQIVEVDTAAPLLTIDNVTADDVLSTIEASSDLTISGTTTAEAGQIVTITLDNYHYFDAVVNADGTWSVTLTPDDMLELNLTDGLYNLQATVSDKAGNSVTTDHSVLVDVDVPVITFDTIAGDDIINSTEHGQPLIISGTSTGAAAGDVLTLTIAGRTYTTTIDADGDWSIGVPASVVAGLADGSVTISASLTDRVGNVGAADHDVTVSTVAPTLTIDAVTADDVINAAEKASGLTLNGTTTGVEAGQQVMIKFGGVDYTATVQADGSWTVNVPPAYLANMKDGDLTVTATVTNVEGNSANAQHVTEMDSAAPTLTINNVTSDNILNTLEVGEDLVLSGTTNAQAGQHVTINLNGVNYDAVVNADGTWSTTVPAADLGALAEGYVTVTAVVEDQAGNATNAAREISVDTTAPTVSIDVIAIDDIINAVEHGLSKGISGTATGASAGDMVTVTIGNQTFHTIVNANGYWSVGVPADVIAGLADGSYTVTATVTDHAGNSGSDSRVITVETTPPQISIDTLAVDDIINAAEKGQPLTISGTSDQPDGTIVNVTLNGTTYDAVIANGQWSLDVPASMVAALGEANYTVTASVTAANGNTSNVAHNVLVDSVAPSVTIDAVTSDDVLNSGEVSSGHTFTGSVTGAKAGAVVTITIGGETFTTTVANDLTWSISLTADQLKLMGEGDQVITAYVTDTSGNTGDASHYFEINAGLPGININTVSGDDIINAIEMQEDLYLTGTSDDFNLGDEILVKVNGQTYHVSVNQDGSWIVQIPAADVANFPDGAVKIHAEGTNSLGNQVSATHTVTVDSTGVAITIDTIAADDIINQVEQGQPLILSGKVASVEVGQTIVVAFGGDTYLATVEAGGVWSCSVPVAALATLPEGNLAVSVSVTNQAGNSASAARDVTVDVSAPMITINPISTDNMLNSVEKGQDLIVSGSSHGLESGRPLTVTLNGETYTTTVDNNGNWTITVPAADVANLNGNLTVTAESTDRAGNPSSAQGNLVVDTTPPTLTIDDLTEDNTISISEHNTAQVVSGTSDAIGQIVTVTIGGETYTTQVRLDGTWVIGVPKVVINSLASGEQHIEATVSDAAGNQISADHIFDVEGGLPSLTIDTIAIDDIINALEKGADLVISGDSTSLNSGALIVTVNLNGKNYTATIGTDGLWTVSVPSADLAAMADGAYQVTANASTAAGTPASVGKTIVVDSQDPSLTINTVTADDVINAQEYGAPLVLSGTYGNVEAGQTLTIELNGQTYTVVTTGTGGAWSITVPAADVAALVDGGNYNVTVSLNDVAGNQTQVTKPISVDLTGPVITIDPVTGDNVLGSDETIANVTISGTTDAPVGQPLVVTFNGRNYSATVNADGTWSVEVPAAHLIGIQDGQYQVSVAVSDTAGNSTVVTENVAVTSIPPELVIDTFAGDDWVNIAEHGKAHAITGTSDAIGQQITVTLNGKNYITTVKADGSWSVNISVADMAALTAGTATITATVANAAGNEISVSHDFEVDLTAPGAITIDSITQDTGESASDFITADSNFVLKGSLAAALDNGEKAQISLDGGATWIDLVVNGTSWSYANSAALADGSYEYQVRLIDEAGNISPIDGKTVVVDTVAPTAAASIVSYTDDEGLRAGTFDQVHNITDDVNPQINGILSAALAAGEYIAIYRDGVLVGRATMTSSTTWTFTDSALASATYGYVAKVIDTAGNETVSSEFELIVDTSVPTTQALVNALTTHDTTPIISGTLTESLVNGQYVEVTINGVTYSSEIGKGYGVVVDPNNNTWYVQIPDDLALEYKNYTVTTQVKSGAGNGNNALATTATVSVVADSLIEPALTMLDGSTDNTTGYSATYGIGSNGLWEFFANGKNAWATDQTSYTVGNDNKKWVLSTGNNYDTVNATFADYNRDGHADVMIGQTDYGGSRIPLLTANGNGGYTASHITGDALVWYGASIAFDREGDGYLDFVIGDAGGPDSYSFVWNNNGTLVVDADNHAAVAIKPGTVVNGYRNLIEVSGVDLNNDGQIDLAQHVPTGTGNSRYTMATLMNQGDGSFVWGQEVTSAFVSADGSGQISNAVSMTWADFNGDGSMDLFMPMSRLTSTTNQGVLMLNDGNGQLGAAAAVGSSYASNTSVAVDWDHDGDMDIIKLASTNTASNIFLNNGSGVFSQSSQTIAGKSGKVSGAALMDYDWDGAQDLMIFRQTANQSVTLVRNTNEVDYGTSIHLKILDSQGMNVFYGNTVNLYDSQGNRVASQIINPQSGIGINDASALVNFYGLDANETYHAELVRAIGTTSANVTWDGLKAGDATHNYTLSAAASNGNHTDTGVGTVGTGYNDTFIADTGTHAYNGSGGWEYHSGQGTWVANGGQDTVDFINATTGITADLSKATTQNTGFNNASFTNIEGLAGSNQADTITGNSGNNIFEGRGGNDTFNIGNGGHDTLLYKLLNSSDATGGNGADTINGFSVGTFEGTADSDRIDLSELLQGSGYTGNGTAHYVNGVATLDAGAGNIADFIKVNVVNGNTEIAIDRDGNGGNYAATTVVTITGVQTDLATLLANHQLTVI
jgi:hypothetical protein